MSLSSVGNAGSALNPPAWMFRFTAKLPRDSWSSTGTPDTRRFPLCLSSSGAVVKRNGYSCVALQQISSFSVSGLSASKTSLCKIGTECHSQCDTVWLSCAYVPCVPGWTVKRWWIKWVLDKFKSFLVFFQKVLHLLIQTSFWHGAQDRCKSRIGRWCFELQASSWMRQDKMNCRSSCDLLLKFSHAAFQSEN